jgi:hypothetical protein
VVLVQHARWENGALYWKEQRMEGMSRRDRVAATIIVIEMFRDLASGHRIEASDAHRDEFLRRMCETAWPTPGAQCN